MNKLYDLLDVVVDLDEIINNGKYEYIFFGEPSFNMRYLHTINGETVFVFYEYDRYNEANPSVVIGMNPTKETARVIEFESKVVNWYAETNTERFIRYIKEKLQKAKTL